MDEARRGEAKLGFEMSGKWLLLADILPSRRADGKLTTSRKYATVVASIREVGIVEPLVVHPLGTKAKGKYLLLDGHLRLEALKELGHERACCLISTDDEAYTYNVKVNQVSAIQEHFMILRALERGASEERIASALKVNVGRIREKRNLLQDICPEAVTLLKDATAPAGKPTPRATRTQEDWERMRERYDAADAGRYPEDLDDRCARLRTRDEIAGIHFSGPFWQLRD
jgi:hypothetical protein